MSDKVEIEIELTKKYKVMIYQYVEEKEMVTGKVDRYKQYHSNSLWEYDGFDQDDYMEIYEFLKELEFRKKDLVEEDMEKNE